MSSSPFASMNCMPESMEVVLPQTSMDLGLKGTFGDLSINLPVLGQFMAEMGFEPDEITSTVLNFSSVDTAESGVLRRGNYNKPTGTISLFPLSIARRGLEIADMVMRDEAKKSGLPLGKIREDPSWDAATNRYIGRNLTETLLHELKHRYDHIKGVKDRTEDAQLGKAMFKEFCAQMGGVTLAASGVIASGEVLLPNRLLAAAAAISSVDVSLGLLRFAKSHITWSHYLRDPAEIRANAFADQHKEQNHGLITVKLAAQYSHA